MLKPRWRKIFRDLWGAKTRSALVVAVITVGVFSVASILTAYSVLIREMDASYLATNPASAVLYVNDASDSLVASAQLRPEIATAEARRELIARLDIGDGERTDIRLIVVRDFSSIQISQAYPETGKWPPTADEILIERAALTVAGLKVGGTVLLSTPASPQQAFTVVGTAYDPGQTPAWIAGTGLGYITVAGLERLGEEPTLDRLLIATTDVVVGKPAIRQVALDLGAYLEAQGIPVLRIDVPEPGEHPNSPVMKTLLALLGAFGVLSLVLSAVLVATVISALMARETVQIAVMKTVGARTHQIATMYLGGVVLLGGLAFLIGLPLGTVAGNTYADFIAGRLNFDIADYAIAPWVHPLALASALLVPAIAAMIPVIRGSRITIREGLDDSGASMSAGAKPVGRILSSLRCIRRVPMLGIRNTFRRHGRLTLTVVSLAFGGAVFMTALNVGESWNQTVDTEFNSRGYDLALLASPLDPSSLGSVVVPESLRNADIEFWRAIPANLRDSTGEEGSSLALVVSPPDSQMARYPLLSGRRLQDDVDGVVINHTLARTVPGLTVGSEIAINVGGNNISLTVVGIVRQLANTGAAYVSAEQLASADLAGSSNVLVRVATESGLQAPDAAALAMENALLSAGFAVTSVRTAAMDRKVFDDHWLLIVGMLMAMAVLVATVGGLGMASAMSLNVMERRREIGVMRAVGATTSAVLQVILTEGLLIGAMSWMVALAFSIPLSALVGDTVGDMLIETPLELAISPFGAAIWLAIVIVISGVSSAIPALEASELPVHQVLAYE
jgi:putative ABC transport system permease protein